MACGSTGHAVAATAPPDRFRDQRQLLPALRAVTEFLVAISLVITVVSNYLIINKLWKRRAVGAAAESLSVGAALLGLSTALPFLVLFVAIDHSPASAAMTIIGVVFVLITLRQSVADYLALHPPRDQAAHLIGVLHLSPAPTRTCRGRRSSPSTRPRG